MDDRAAINQHLAQAERHVRHGEIQLSRQRRVIQDLERGGQLVAAVEARRLLEQFEQLQRVFVADRDRLTAGLAASR